MAPHHLAVQLVQRGKLEIIKRLLQHDDQIDIADIGIEVAADKRTVQIDSDELLPQYRLETLQQWRYYVRNRRAGVVWKRLHHALHARSARAHKQTSAGVILITVLYSPRIR